MAAKQEKGFYSTSEFPEFDYYSRPVTDDSFEERFAEAAKRFREEAPEEYEKLRERLIEAHKEFMEVFKEEMRKQRESGPFGQLRPVVLAQHCLKESGGDAILKDDRDDEMDIDVSTGNVLDGLEDSECMNDMPFREVLNALDVRKEGMDGSMQKRYETLMEELRTSVQLTQEEKLLIFSHIATLMCNFRDDAVKVFRDFISSLQKGTSDKFFHDDPAKTMGYAGGTKFKSEGFFFKTPIMANDGGKKKMPYDLYEHGAKVLNKELQAMTYINSWASKKCPRKDDHVCDEHCEGICGSGFVIQVPMMVMIDMYGVRCLAMSDLSDVCSKDNIVYGSSDGGKTIVQKLKSTDPAMRQLKNLARTNNLQINKLKDDICMDKGIEEDHNCFPLAYDIELHEVEKDRKYYAVDTARLFPPLPTGNRKKHMRLEGLKMHKRMRPELVKLLHQGINSEWADPNTENVSDFDLTVCDTIGRQIELFIDAYTNIDIHVASRNLNIMLHGHGINMFFYGHILYRMKRAGKDKGQFAAHYNRIAAEMIARALRKIVNQCMRAAIKRNSATDENMKIIVVQLLNSLFGNEGLPTTEMKMFMETHENKVPLILTWKDINARCFGSEMSTGHVFKHPMFSVKPFEVWEVNTEEEITLSAKNIFDDSNGFIFAEFMSVFSSLCGIWWTQKSWDNFMKQKTEFMSERPFTVMDIHEISPRIKNTNLFYHALGQSASLSAMIDYHTHQSGNSSIIENMVKRFRSAVEAEPWNPVSLRNFAVALEHKLFVDDSVDRGVKAQIGELFKIAEMSIKCRDQNESKDKTSCGEGGRDALREPPAKRRHTFDDDEFSVDKSPMAAIYKNLEDPWKSSHAGFTEYFEAVFQFMCSNYGRSLELLSKCWKTTNAMTILGDCIMMRPYVFNFQKGMPTPEQCYEWEIALLERRNNFRHYPYVHLAIAQCRKGMIKEAGENMCKAMRKYSAERFRVIPNVCHFVDVVFPECPENADMRRVFRL